ncbi:MAG TPA: universal stress protein [Rhodanobacter sp.]|nr:universal stress protein [Rhodanobacter sp.]
MSPPTMNIARPGRILLATDLSARCDRALDRAARLATEWQVPLLVVHAMPRDVVTSWPSTDDTPSWRQPPDTVAAIERQIRRDLGHEVDQLAIHVAEGKPADVILDLAKREGCDLIVLGASHERSGHSVLGRTAEALIRKSSASLLVVRNRPREAYRQILIGTDFTVESRHGLHVATTWFPQASFVLMHALDIPYKSLWLDPARREEFTRLELGTIEDFLADARLPDPQRQRIRPMIEHGHPEIMLRNYVLEEGADLTVIGALRRGLAFHMLVGGSARRIVQEVPGDILVVRAGVAQESAQESGQLPD